MKDDIKKKFIDILFETDDDEDEMPELVSQAVEEMRNEGKGVSARDIMYRKSDQSVFVNLDEKEKVVQSVTGHDPKEDNKDNRYGDYELSAQISPIFGVISEGNREVFNKPANEKLLSKPDSSHLEIITSPIYGYGTREDYENDGFSKEPERKPLFEEGSRRIMEDEYFVDHTYDDFGTDDDELNLFNSYEEEDY